MDNAHQADLHLAQTVPQRIAQVHCIGYLDYKLFAHASSFSGCLRHPHKRKVYLELDLRP